MAKVPVTVIECDKCHTQDNDPTKFLHVIVQEVQVGKGKLVTLTKRDLCIESCVGAPGVNRDKV